MYKRTLRRQKTIKGNGTIYKNKRSVDDQARLKGCGFF